MITVTVMLGIIFGTVITLTHKNIEQQSISAMRNIAMPPKPDNKSEKEFEHIPKPHFSLLLDKKRHLLYNMLGLIFLIKII